jgi:hypothetical protein
LKPGRESWSLVARAQGSGRSEGRYIFLCRE